MAICKRCGKEIKFVKTKKGKWLPVEQEMIIITPVEKIGRPFITEDGQMVYGLPTAPDCCYTGISDIKAYPCHFANCLYSGKQNKYYNNFARVLQEKLLHAIIIIGERTEPKCLQPVIKKC